MKRRIYMKYLFIFIKWIFWIAFGYGVFLLSAIPSTEVLELRDTEKGEGQNRKEFYGSTAGSFDNATGSSKSACDKMSFPALINATERWQHIDKSRSMYCFSAYYVQDRSTVFIVGVRPRNQVNLFCQFWIRTQKGLAELAYETEADIRVLLDDFGYRYAPTIFECYVKMETTVHYVSLTTRHCQTPSNILEIQNATRGTTYKRKYTLCLTPLVFQYDKTADFIKWVEINRQLGVDHFVVYNFSSGPNMNQVLKYYSKRGLAEVVQWRPPMIDDNLPSEIKPVELGNFGQTAALNDCIYRNKRESELIANVGLNEYILSVSSNEVSLYEMLTKLKTKFAVYHVTRLVSQKKSGNLNNHEKSLFEKDKLITVKEDKISEILKRGYQDMKTDLSSGNEMTKLIIRPAEVDFVYINNVPGVDAYSIPSKKAVFHKTTVLGKNHLLEEDIDDIVPLSVIKIANKSVKNVWKDIQMFSLNDM